MQLLIHRARLWVGLVAVALLAAVGVAIAAHRLGPKHFEVVAPERLYRSGQLTDAQLRDIVSEYGIRTVVNLRSENERGMGDWYAIERAASDDLGVQHLDLPMNSGFPPRDDVRAEWLRVLDDPAEHPILVHCEYGVVRTGIMVGIYQVEHEGRAPAEVLPEIEAYGGALPEVIHDRIELYFDGYAPEVVGREPEG